MDMILDVLVGGLSAVLAGQAVALLALLLKKIGFVLSADRLAQLQTVALQEIRKVAELSAQKAKAGVIVPSVEKLEMAVIGITSRLPNVSDEEAADAVHAALPLVGEGASSYLKSLLTAVQTPDPSPETES